MLSSFSGKPRLPKAPVIDIVMALLLAATLTLVFRSEIFSGQTLSKFDLLHQFDYFQNLRARGPLVYTDDPSTALTHIPNERFSFYESANGNVPLWNQLNGGGRPFFAEFQTLVWSAFHYWFPSNKTYIYGLGLLFKLYLSGLGSYLLSRRLSLSAWASFAAATAFMLAGRNLHWLELCNNVFFYPWLMLLFLYLGERPSIWRATITGCLTAAAAYNMHPETYACATVTAAFSCLDQYCQFKKGKQLRARLNGIWRWLSWCGFAAIIALMIAAPLILTLIEFIKEGSSYKFEEHSPAFLRWYDYVANLFLPVGEISTYCGPVLGALLLLGLVASWKKHRIFVLWFLALLLFCIRPGFFEAVFLKRPFLFILPEYPLACCILMQSIIAGRGLDELLEASTNMTSLISPFWKKSLVLPSLLAAILLIVGQSSPGCNLLCQFFDYSYAQPQLSWSYLLSTFCLLPLLASQIFLKTRSLLKANLLAPLLCLGNTALLVVVVPSELHTRAQLDYRHSAILDHVKMSESRMVATGCALFQPDTNLVYGIDDFRSLAPIHPRRYAQYAEQAGLRPRISFLQECPSTLNKLFDLASVKYVLSDRAVESSFDLEHESRSISLDTGPSKEAGKSNEVYPDPNKKPSLPLNSCKKLAEGLRLESTQIAYLPGRNCVKIRQLFYLRSDLKNRFYSRFSLRNSCHQVLTSNVWPFLSIEEEGKLSGKHLYAIDSSLVVPLSVTEGSTLSVEANIQDRWTGKDLTGDGLTLAQFKSVKAISDGDFRLLPLEDNGFSLFENKNALARSYIVHSVIYKDSPEAALLALKDGTINWKKEAIIEVQGKESPGMIADQAPVVPREQEYCTILDRNSDSVLISCKLCQPGYLVLTDTFFPGWKAFVDGQELKIYPANFAFRALKMVSGHHIVEFKYAPPAFFWGMKLMNAGIILSLLLFTFSALRILRCKFENNRR